MDIKRIYNFTKNKLFPLNRSLTGKGTETTLRLIQKNIAKIQIKRLKSGTRVFDWEIPDEWNVKDAYIEDRFGKKIVNFKNNNLHLVGYSKPVNLILKKKELLKNLYSIKKLPSAIPYITSYYKKRWGFCISHKEKKKL